MMKDPKEMSLDELLSGIKERCDNIDRLISSDEMPDTTPRQLTREDLKLLPYRAGDDINE